nr:MAG TPA: hypothetical protein [Bacteriophage sp.]
MFLEHVLTLEQKIDFFVMYYVGVDGIIICFQYIVNLSRPCD